jgi:hypothetical protein
VCLLRGTEWECKRNELLSVLYRNKVAEHRQWRSMAYYLPLRWTKQLTEMSHFVVQNSYKGTCLRNWYQRQKPLVLNAGVGKPSLLTLTCGEDTQGLLHVCTVHQWRLKYFILQQMHKCMMDPLWSEICTVILAKHCIKLPDDGSLVIRNMLEQF